jgi:N5-hydroxyornithine acetyltransferase
MVAAHVHLPNGHTLNVSPVFGGFTFKSQMLDLHHSPFPPGWTVVLQTEDEVDDRDERLRRRSKISSTRDQLDDPLAKHTSTHRFTKPTLQHDSLFLSSISMPSSNDFRQPSSPTRQIALMLWATLYWYFHKEAPRPHIISEASSLTPEAGRPKADWRIRIKREGIFKGRNALQKLERMGLVASEDSSVGTDIDIRNPAGWAEMFVSRRSFWQIDGRIFLFSLAPLSHSPFPAASPYPSRPSSPERTGGGSPPPEIGNPNPILTENAKAGISSPGGPFNSGSHLPTFYPPPPTQFTFTNHIRHPIRSKPPRQGETFYTRHIPSVDQWLTFRVPSLSSKPVAQFTPGAIGGSMPATLPPHPCAASVATLPTLSSFADKSSDTDLLHKWMNDPRVNAAWGCAGPTYTQQKFLEDGLASRHSFPVIGCWDGRPFGYFEIYWVKEDKLGRLLGGDVGNYTRGLHVLVGEQEFRGAHRVRIWLDALVHWCWLADSRTETVVLEPRVDNEK